MRPSRGLNLAENVGSDERLKNAAKNYMRRRTGADRDGLDFAIEAGLKTGDIASRREVGDLLPNDNRSKSRVDA